MENKKISYLSNAVEFLEDEINNQDVEAFYRACITQLSKNERLEKPQLRNFYSGKEKSEKTYGNYMDKLIHLLEKFQEEIQSRNAELTLAKRPIIKTHVGGGSGNPTYYYIDFEDWETPPSFNQNAGLQKTETISHDIIYRTKTLKRTPWYLKLTAKLFARTKHRQFFLFFVLIFFIVAPVALGFLIQMLPLTYWTLLVLSYFVLFYPAWNIIKLATQKIALIEHIFQPVGAVCISKVKNVKDSDSFLDIEREILSVVVDATCPICFHKYNLKDSVQLESQSLFNRRIIGKCLNNPKEHRFTFDKDLMTGNPLNT
ncbi:hypothetical protein [Cognaticolwellia aestuarii]|uniref:hypothetical protein n=1 Tax=Cognaticolwellia aestuarii TaxID=329993 RepID=UPI000984B1C9|nr:hypothetical protein [Cognaticolwellia aestuarii]